LYVLQEFRAITYNMRLPYFIHAQRSSKQGTHAARTAVYLDVYPFWRLAFYMFVFQAA
jgi:hypothetical protein